MDAMTAVIEGPGTPESSWQGSHWLNRLPSLQAEGIFKNAARLVVVTPHPDDEVLGCGGLIAMARKRNLPVRIISISDGEACYPESAQWTPDTLRHVRRKELACAMTHLGVESDAIHHLGLPDGQIELHKEKIAAFLKTHLKNTDLVLTPWRLDGHPDHETCGRSVTKIANQIGAQLMEFPIWAWHWLPAEGRTPPSWEDAVRCFFDETICRLKRRAIRCYESQLGSGPVPLDCPPILPPTVIERFERNYEVFLTERMGRYFEHLYRTDDDPFGYRTRWYEQRKRDVLLAALPRPRFQHGWELGCSNGELSAGLAKRCDRLLATDLSKRAVQLATARNSASANVTFQSAQHPEQWPEEQFDLIVFSELGYYMDASTVETIGRRFRQSLLPNGVVIACHWLHPFAEARQSGAEVHRILARTLCMKPIFCYRDNDCLLEAWCSEQDVCIQ